MQDNMTYADYYLQLNRIQGKACRVIYDDMISLF